MTPSRACRRLAHWFIVATVVFVIGCVPTNQVTHPPTTPGAGTPEPVGTPQSAAVDVASCGNAVSASVQMLAAAQPPVLNVPGAGGSDVDHEEGVGPVLPSNPDGVVLDTDPPIELPPPGAQQQPTPQDIVYFGNPVTHQIAANDRFGTAEPDVAVKGSRMMMVWNSAAATSTDRGANYQYIFPGDGTAFVNSDGGFCCDQRVQYVAAYDLWIWEQQYWPSQSSPYNNRIRLVVAHGDAEFDAHTYRYWDFTAQAAGLSPGTWFDQTKMGVSDGYVFLSVNAYTHADGYQTSVVMRIARAHRAPVIQYSRRFHCAPPAKRCSLPATPMTLGSECGAGPIRPRRLPSIGSSTRRRRATSSHFQRPRLTSVRGQVPTR
jgi:hypothetical protein